MLLHVVNIVLEAIALYAVWGRKLPAVRLYLAYLLAYDLLGFAVPNIGYLHWYWYWGTRSLDFLLLFRVCVSTGRRNPVLDVWGWLCAGAYAVLYWRVWSGTLTDAAMQDLSTAAIGLNVSVLLVTLFDRPVMWRVWIGCAAWAAAQLLPVQMYPLTSIVPLLIWSSCVVRRSMSFGGELTNDTVREGSAGSSTAGGHRCSEGASQVFQTAMR